MNNKYYKPIINNSILSNDDMFYLSLKINYYFINSDREIAEILNITFDEYKK